MDDGIVNDREVAALVGLGFGVAAMAVGFLFQLVVVAVPLGALGTGFGGWAAARGERTVTATLAVFVGLAAIVISVIWALTVD